MFISTLEAEKITGFDRSGISKCCNGLQNTANGFCGNRNIIGE